MARLTRTAKYADLREQLANDKEESLSTQDLSSYQNRLDNVQDNLSFGQKMEEPEYTWAPSNDETSSFSQPTGNFEAPRQENSYFDSFINSSIEEPKQNTNFNAYFENTIKNISPVETIKDVFDDVKDDSGEIVSMKERDTYLNQTFSDVKSYNVNSGLQTIDQLLESSVEEVRHPENVAQQPIREQIVNNAQEPLREQIVNNTQEPTKEQIIDNTQEQIREQIVNNAQEPLREQIIDNTQVWPKFKQEEVLDTDNVKPVNAFQDEKVGDEEFSNTVSMEISKIMDEIVNDPVEEKVEEVVEIKNIAEIEAEPAKENTMSSTIPFVVAAEDEEVLEEDDEEEDGSNTVLNIILIVLIVVLVAVLGLIVFYILKTKGIF